MTNTATVEKNYSIRDIEALTEEQAKELSEESMVIKEHNVYFIDFPGYFGYSACVYINGHHIHYANDYALHHPKKTKEELKQWYIGTLNNKLFTEGELTAPITSYDDYTRKNYFLTNYYPMREDYISAFRINSTDEEEKAFEKSVENMYYNPVSFSYFKDKEFVQHCIKLHVALQEAKNNTLDNYDYWKSAFVSEMCNHEYAINWQGDYDVLSVFGNPEWRFEEGKNTLDAWFKDCEFNDLQRRAYMDARNEYYRMADEKGWF